MAGPGLGPALRELFDRLRANSVQSRVDTQCCWAPPDLRAGGAWFNCRLTSLFRAAKEHGHRWVELVNQGLDALSRHRRNHDATGANPEQLQVLWWEFPREHWDALREGSRMNFLDPPDSCMHPNGEMTEDQARVAEAFVDELIDLVMVAVPLDHWNFGKFQNFCEATARLAAMSKPPKCKAQLVFFRRQRMVIQGSWLVCCD